MFPATKAQTTAGFTLIETFVAISLLMLALVGPLTLARQSIQSGAISEDRIAAFYLAQDAMEFVRNVRDSNLQSGSTWLEPIANRCGGNGCYIDTSRSLSLDAAIQGCSGACPYLRYDSDPSSPTYNRYGYSAGEESPFRRTVRVDMLNADEARITVTITWERNGVTRNFTARQLMFNFLSSS